MQDTMKTNTVAIVVVLAASAAIPGSVFAAAGLIHEWTFDDGTATDVVGGLNGTLHGNAVISNGKLVLDGSYRTYMDTALDSATLTEKTLISWVSLATPNQGGGSALSIVNLASQEFDAVDYGERVPHQWISGSDYFNRTLANNGGAAVTDSSYHMLAYSYASSGITIYLDGASYANAGAFSPQLFNQPDYLIGLRHQAAGGFNGNGYLAGSVDQASVYNRALSASDVATLYAEGPSAVPEPASWALMLIGFGGLGVAVRARHRVAV